LTDGSTFSTMSEDAMSYVRSPCSMSKNERSALASPSTEYRSGRLGKNSMAVSLVTGSNSWKSAPIIGIRSRTSRSSILVPTKAFRSSRLKLMTGMRPHHAVEGI